MGRGDGEEECDGGEERAEGEEQPAVPEEGAARRTGPEGSRSARARQTADHESEGGDCGQGVVLLARGEGEEDEDEAGPEKKGEGGFACIGVVSSATGKGEMRGYCSLNGTLYGWSDCAEVADVAGDGGGEEGCPGKEPEGGEEPEEEDGDLAVVVGDAALQEAGDVLVVEIEPGPACTGGQAEAGGHRDGRIAQRGEDVPWGGDEEEEQCGWDEMELEKKTELAGEGEVEQDKGDGEDEADDSLGEKVEGGDGGEDEAREECGFLRLINRIQNRDVGHPILRLHGRGRSGRRERRGSSRGR